MASLLKVDCLCMKFIDMHGSYHRKLRTDFTLSYVQVNPVYANTLVITGEDLRELLNYYHLTGYDYERAVLCHFPNMLREEAS